MFEVSSSSITFAAAILGSALAGSATALIVVAVAVGVVAVLRETLPYLERAAPEFPDWWNKLLNERWERKKRKNQRLR